MSQNYHRTTTFQLSDHLHTQVKMMCTLTHKSMGEFIRLALIDKIKEIKGKPHDKPLDRETIRDNNQSS